MLPFCYDINGIRQEKKTASGITHNYYTEGNIIHKETRGGNELWYYYDATGITGMEYNGAVYFFLKNIQGDITRIVDASGKLVARYIYDAWGCHKVYNASGVVTTDTAHIGNINPFRYRGYYYDAETGLYYLNSRYYDPEAGRFINADSIGYIDPETINGLNLYSYCGNDPVNRIDPTGHAWEWGTFWRALGSSLAVIGGIALCFVPGAQLIGAGLIIAGAGGLIGGGIGAATGYGFSVGWDIGTLIGGVIGLAVAAPQLWSLAANLTLPTFGWMSTTAGSLVFGITGTVAVAIPVGAVAVGAAALGLTILFARTGKSGGYWVDKYSDDHAPDHAHLKGQDGTNIRIDKNGNPLPKENGLNSQQRKAIKRLLDQIRRLFGG